METGNWDTDKLVTTIVLVDDTHVASQKLKRQGIVLDLAFTFGIPRGTNTIVDYTSGEHVDVP